MTWFGSPARTLGVVALLAAVLMPGPAVADIQGWCRDYKGRYLGCSTTGGYSGVPLPSARRTRPDPAQGLSRQLMRDPGNGLMNPFHPALQRGRGRDLREERAVMLLRQGMHLYNAGNYFGALQQFQLAQRLAPASPDVRYAVAEAATALSNRQAKVGEDAADLRRETERTFARLKTVLDAIAAEELGAAETPPLGPID